MSGGRLIDVDALREARLLYCSCLNDEICKGNYSGETPVNYEVADAIDACLDNAPVVDAVPVVPGRWITRNKGQNNWCECSNCSTVGSPFWKRCPVCEAKMDGGGESV